MRPLHRLLHGFGLFALVAALTGALSVSAQTDSSEKYPVLVSVIQCEGPTTSGAPCAPLAGVTITVGTAGGIGSGGTCITELTGDSAACSVPMPLDTDVLVVVDADTVTPGYAVVNDLAHFTTPSAQDDTDGSPDVGIVVIPADELAGQQADQDARVERNQSPAPSPDAAAPSVAAAQPTTVPGSAGTGSPAAIYAGDCDTADLTVDPVAVLSETTAPDGDPVGADTASVAETSFTTLDLPLDDILADDHVLVVFDEDDDSVPLACGAVGGIVTDDGTLAFGLPAVGESRYSGVAYLTENGDQTDATLFLAEDLSGDETPPA